MADESNKIDLRAREMKDKTERELFLLCRDILSLVRSSAISRCMRVATNEELQTSSIFDEVPHDKREKLMEIALNAKHIKPLQRCGMSIFTFTN